MYAATAIVGPVADELDQLRSTAAAHFISGAGEELGRWWLRNPTIPRERIVGYHCDFVMAIVADIKNR